MKETPVPQYHDLGTDSNIGSTIFFRSNERRLHLLFNFVGSKTGGVFGLGSDQTLDIHANTASSHAFLFDYSKPTTLLIRALLETGIRLRKDLGRDPETLELTQKFAPEQQDRLANDLSDVMDETDISTVIDLLQPKPSVAHEKLVYIHYYDFMRFRANLPDQSGEPFAWYSTPDKIRKTLDSYDAGRIHIIHGDLYDLNDVGYASYLIRASRGDLDILYLSNLEGYGAMIKDRDSESRLVSLWRNIETLPIREDAVILRTTKNRLLELEPLIKGTSPGMHVFHEWHYNAEDYTHHREKTKRDPNYPDLGWIQYAFQIQSSRPYVSYLG